MGSLFSRARGGSEAAESGAEVTSEVEAVSRAAATPGAPRASPPLPLEVPALALACTLRPTCARIAGARWPPARLS